MTDEKKIEETVPEEATQEESQQQPEEDRFGRLWKDVKKGLKDFSAVAVEKAEEFGKLASDKAEELTKTGKLRIDVMQLKRSLTKQLAQLGHEAYTLNKGKKLAKLADSEVFKAAVSEVDRLEAEIAAKEAEIVKLQEEEQSE